MKFANFLLNLLIVLLFLSQKLFAANYKVDDILTGKFHINKKTSIELPDGDWIVAEKVRSNYYTMNFKEYALLKIKENKAIEGILISEALTAGVYENAVNLAIHEALFQNQYEGCYKRPEYTLVNVFQKGSTHNCLIVEHTDIHQDVYNPKDPDAKTRFTKLKKWLNKNDIQLPKIALLSTHSYFSRLAGGKWYVLQYVVDPKILNGPKNKFITVETSEYHPSNILSYANHKKIMDDWVLLSKKRHKEFEISVNTLERHSIIKSDDIVVKEGKSESKVVKQLKELNNLYKSGALSKEEFEKAKKKILD